MIENFNDRYQQRFLGKVIMVSEDDLRVGSRTFEERHNNRYRCSKLKGHTPLKALAASHAILRFPKEEAPTHRLKKPEVGKYHVVRLIRSDLKLNIFGECFSAPPETMLEYVVATIDVKYLQRFLGVITGYEKAFNKYFIYSIISDTINIYECGREDTGENEKKSRRLAD